MRASKLSFDRDEPAHLVFRIEEVRAAWIKRTVFTVVSFGLSLVFETPLGAQPGSRFRVVLVDSGRVLKRYRDKLIWYGEVSAGQTLRFDLSELTAGEFAERWVFASQSFRFGADEDVEDG